MPTVFTRIIDGDLPARFVWRDEQCVGFLSINPLGPGHVLVVPRVEVEHWIDLDPALWNHLTDVSRTVGTALYTAYRPEKVGLMLAGLEVPHVHVHVLPINSVHDLDFANADPDPDPGMLDEVADVVRGALSDLGAQQVAE